MRAMQWVTRLPHACITRQVAAGQGSFSRSRVRKGSSAPRSLTLVTGSRPMSGDEMQVARPVSDVVGFDTFEFDVQAGELRKDGRRIKIQEQPFRVLSLLLERIGEVVTREELREQL